MISTSRPEQIEKLVEKYEADLTATEENYINVVINSGGSLDYQSVMSMPVPAVKMYVKKLNEIREAQNEQIRKASNRR